jgi:hypothetical protein
MSEASAGNQGGKCRARAFVLAATIVQALAERLGDSVLQTTSLAAQQVRQC